jgi:hypothetical protein
MTTISRRSLLASLLAVPALAARDSTLHAGEEWTPLFDGRSLKGWRPGDASGAWSVKDGGLVASGPTSHLYHQGPVRGGAFRNFALKAEVLTGPGARGGIFFHTAFQQDGIPAQGLKVQICNTRSGEGVTTERAKTGSLHGIRNVYKVLAKDGAWSELLVLVRGRNVQVSLDGTLLVDYTEPSPSVEAGGRALGSGTFALQALGPNANLSFRNVRLRSLPDDAAPASLVPAALDDVDRRLLRLSGENYPLVDYHVHLKGWTLDEALRESRRTGIYYGIAVNCGVGFPVDNDAGAREFLKTMAGQPVFIAMQGEGREWVKTFSPETAAQFDYVFTDSMTFTDDRGKRMRLWIPEEVGEIEDRQRFMDVIVDRTVGVLSHEPIDIYVNPAFVPAPMQADYDALWTQERMSKVIEAAKRHGIAIEINARYRLPRAPFIRLAKQAGVRFAFGTNNATPNMGRLEYCLDMVDECGLEWPDIFVPPVEGRKAAQRRRTE